MKEIYLTKKDVEQVVHTFSQIDDKILSLHMCSSDDFNEFNQRLKQYHQCVKDINQNSDHILSIIDSDKTSTLFTKLNFFHYQLKTYAESFEKKITKSIDDLELLLRYINAIFLPIKNYRQNLITFKYLMSNFKLNMAYSIAENADMVNQEMLKLDSQIEKTNLIYPLLEQTLDEFKGTIYKTISTYKVIRDKSAMNASTILYQTDYSLNILNARHVDIITQVINLKKKTADCSDNVSSIITNLQFHDIIRQKIEHIQQTNKTVIHDMLGDTNLEDLSLQRNMAHKIKDVAELQIAQLTHTNKKYQAAIEMIVRQFNEIAENMSLANNTGHYYTEDSNPFNEVEEELKNGIRVVKDFSKAMDEFYTQIKTIEQKAAHILDIHDNLIKRTHAIDDIVNTIITKLSETKQNKDASRITKYLKDAGSFSKYINNMIDLVTKITSLSHSLSTSVPLPNTDEDLKPKIDTINTQIHSLVNELIDANQQILQIFRANTSMGQNVTQDIRFSINQVKYYDVFDKVMKEDIIGKLDTIYDIVAKGIGEQDAQSKAAHLSAIEQLYTMASEREIHHKVALFDDALEQGEKIEDDGDVELF